MQARRTWEGGIVAGLVASVVHVAFGALFLLLSGRDLWPAVKMAAFPFLGERAIAVGFDPFAVALGIACHMLVAVAWGLLFAVAFYGLAGAATVAAGLFWGVVVWVVMYYVVLPLVGAGEIVENVPIWAALAQHLLFGGTVGAAFLPFQAPFVRPPYDRDVFVRP